MGTEMEKQHISEVAGTYLNRDLQGLARKAGRMIVVSNYVCDLNDVIAKKDEEGEFQVASELKNDSDWRLFQELTAQADVIITGSAYLKRFAKKGENAENVLNQFDKGGQFEDLGNWREAHKLKRNPDIAIVARSMDFDIPEAALEGNKKVIIFTTYEGATSPQAKEFKGKGIYVIGSGVDGVDGEIMTDFLASKMAYRVAKMTTGPRVLKILMDANVLDELYITRVQKEIVAKPDDVQTILGPDKKISDLQDFTGTRLLHQEGVTTEDGETVTQDFWVYENKSFLTKIGA
jgi:riboflavin biosynthesis pyrimidine reductase